MTKLTVTIIVLNEEENISKCLESLRNLADEIIVIDGGSNDQTVKIAKKYGKVFARKFDNFASQKNFAVEKASNDWILALDADEVVTQELAAEIKKAINTLKFQAYLIPRRNFILGAEIKHSRWSPDKHIWLWNKKFGRWEKEIHEEVVVKGKVGELKNAKLHFQDKTVREFIQKNNNYSTRLARQLYKSGVQFNMIRFFWDPLFEFSIRYIYKLGFLDGWRGFVLAILMAYYRMQVWVKLLNLRGFK